MCPTPPAEEGVELPGRAGEGVVLILTDLGFPMYGGVMAMDVGSEVFALPSLKLSVLRAILGKVPQCQYLKIIYG